MIINEKLWAMISAELSLTIMKYFGLWRPTTWTSKWAIRFYNVYSYFMLAYVYVFVLTFLVGLCQNFHDIDIFTENMFFFSGSFVLSFKVTYICIHREDIISLMNMFLQTNCSARDDHERASRKKFDEIGRSTTRTLLILCLISATSYVSGPLTKGKNVTLPLRSWVPFNTDSRSVFWMIYIYQGSGFFIEAFMFSATEVLASIIMQQICAQLEIIMYRLHELPYLSKRNDSEIHLYLKESQFIRDCSAHHDYMYTVGRKLNDHFGFMVFVQFFGAMVNLCSIVFQLSKMRVFNVRFWSVASIVISIIFQIFFNCWYGDKMIEKSLGIADAVYEINWLHLSDRTKKQLILIMVRASRPIELSGASLITLSVGTFVKIVKSSYSAFNLLVSS